MSSKELNIDKLREQIKHEKIDFLVTNERVGPDSMSMSQYRIKNGVIDHVVLSSEHGPGTRYNKEETIEELMSRLRSMGTWNISEVSHPNGDRGLFLTLEDAF